MEQNQIQLTKKLSNTVDNGRIDSNPDPRSGTRKFSSPALATSPLIDPAEIQRSASTELAGLDPSNDSELPLHGELMGFFDNCAKLIAHLMSAQK